MAAEQPSKFIPKLPMINYDFREGEKLPPIEFMKKLKALKCDVMVVDALTNKSGNNATVILKRVVLGSKYFPNDLTIYAASRKPPMDTLLELNRPLVWIKFDLNSSVRVFYLW